MPETGIEPVRPLFTKRRILSPMCLPISPLGHVGLLSNKNASPTDADEAFVTRSIWRRGPESNRTNRICNPGHNRFATAPEIHISLTKKGSICFPFCGNWSGKRVSNSRPQPWQGCALPTELFPRFKPQIIAYFLATWQLVKNFLLSSLSKYALHQCLIESANCTSETAGDTPPAGTGSSSGSGTGNDSSASSST